MADPPPATVPWPVATRPRLRLAARARLADRDFAVRYLGSYHALHLHEYEGRMRLGDRRLTLQPGDVVLTPAGVPSWYDLPEPGQHLVVHFYDPTDHEPIHRETGDAGAGRDEVGLDDARERVHLPIHMSLGRRQQLARYQLTEIAHLQAQSQQRASARYAAPALFQSLLLWLVAEAAHAAPRRGSDQTEIAVRWAAQLIEQQLHARLTVPRLARHVGLSQNYLARCFRARFGMTIPRYLLQRRIETARDLLETTGLPIGDIARRVGMADPHHFNKQFRALMGVSPSDYRKAGGALIDA